MSISTRQGVVYLVGAGPGNPDLITVRARQVLDECDAVVFDSLIPDELLVTLPVTVDRRYVGKRSGHHSLPQPEINDLLVRLASQGKRVVRLKGGDPFVFGRGAEEAAYLREHGIPFEIVPGITSGVAALSYAGIPCTDRSRASYVMFLTGHQAVEKAVSGVPWDWVAGAKRGTLVIYMGVAEIQRIVDQLTGAGMPPDTPAAAVERGTLPTQRVVTTVLRDLPARVAEEGIRAPALFVVGDVARCHEEIDWFRDRPLFGVRVMVTRPADQSEWLYRELRELGAEVLAYPTIATVEDFRNEPWDTLRRLPEEGGWLVFTSENGVRYFMKQWYATVGDVRRLSRFRVAAMGDGAIRCLNAHNIAPDFVPSRSNTSALAAEMVQKLPMGGVQVVRVRGNLGDRHVERALEGAGARVISLPVYRTFPSRWLSPVKDKLLANPPDVILFTSGAAVDGMAANLDSEEMRELCESSLVLSIGPSTSTTLRLHGLRVDLESRARAVSQVVGEIVAYHRATSLAGARGDSRGSVVGR